MAADNEQFVFQPVQQRDVLAAIKIKNKETVELFEKWGMKHHMRFEVFSYNKLFKLYQKQAFVQDFFSSDVVNSHLMTLSSTGQWNPLGMGGSIDDVTVNEVTCSVMNMDFFDRITTEGIAKPSGQIAKCFDEVVEGFLVSDELRKMLIMEDSEHYQLFSAEDRSELIFRLLLHLSLGGPVNQYEDSIVPYLDTIKLLYKELVLVVKDSNTKKVSIASTVLEVQAKVGEDTVFPSHTHHIQTFCYLIIDNAKRHVTVWYHIWH